VYSHHNPGKFDFEDLKYIIYIQIISSFNKEDLYISSAFIYYIRKESEYRGIKE